MILNKNMNYLDKKRKNKNKNDLSIFQIVNFIFIIF